MIRSYCCKAAIRTVFDFTTCRCRLLARRPHVQDFGTDALEALEAAVTFAPNPLAAVREARAWRDVVACNQVNEVWGVAWRGVVWASVVEVRRRCDLVGALC